MKPVSVWLERFRRSAGVPAAASDDLEVELMSVFVALEEIEAEARRLREEAAREAQESLATAAAEAERVLAGWRRRAEAERARAEAERIQAVTSEARSIESEGEAAAHALRSRGLRRIPPLVERVLACVMEQA